MLLEHLKETARRSYHGISMDPERRGADTVREYSAELASDLQSIPAEERAQYQARYESYFRSWLTSQGNCVSSFIAGPSNFPVRQQEKRRGWADNKFNAWRSWREKALKGIERRQRREERSLTSPREEAELKLAKIKAAQEFMKEVNTAHKAWKAKPESLEGKIFIVMGKDRTEEARNLIQNYVPDYSWNPHPFPGWQLKNNGAEIRRMEKRVVELAEKEVMAATDKDKKHEFPGGYIVENYQEDRLQIFHAEKPDRDVINKLKSEAFHWSPTNRCWQRQLTNAARYAAFKITGVDLFPKAV